MQATEVKIKEWTAPFDNASQRERLQALDTTFTTDMIYDLEHDKNSFRLVPRVLEIPVQKQYQLDLDAQDRHWDRILVAEENEFLCGYLAFNYKTWNQRVCVWHFYVAPEHRRKGVGALLMERLTAIGKDLRANIIWVETNNINYPAIQLYQRLGFSICGLDTSLYSGTECGDETAIFLAREID